jgi:hypothetical protein
MQNKSIETIEVQVLGRIAPGTIRIVCKHESSLSLLIIANKKPLLDDILT